MNTEELRKAAKCVFLACQEAVANDLSSKFHWAADEIDRLTGLLITVATSQEPCEKCNYWKSYDVNFDFCPECGLALDR